MTKIEIIAIGNELLKGKTLDTNSHFLAQNLSSAGYNTCHISQCQDDSNELNSALNLALSRSDIVILTGGLGTTCDDITLQTTCEYFKSKLKLDPKLFNKIKNKVGHILSDDLIEKSSYVPVKGETFKNAIGMAPGYIFKKNTKRVFLLPGVPHEFKHLIKVELIPFLNKHYPITTRLYEKIIHITDVGESVVGKFIDSLNIPKITYGIYPRLKLVSIHLSCTANSLQEANKILNPALSKIKKAHPNKYFSAPFQSTEEAIHNFLIKKKLTLSIAESCTGGSLSYKFTKQADASKYFKGSTIAYSNFAKVKFLKVKESTIKKYGAVSIKCAEEMAKGASKVFETDLAFATTGIAGPSGGTKEKPVGTIFIAIAYQGEILVSKRMQYHSNREVNIEASINCILALFWENRDNI